MKNAEAIKKLQKQKAEYLEKWVDFSGVAEAYDMAIEALSKPNYESDNEVRLAVTDSNKDKVVLWYVFGEQEYYPTSHGRLIDAGALSEKLCGTTIFIKDGEVFQRMINDAPTVQADRPHGEWYRDSEGTWSTVDFAYCSECKQPIIHKHASPLWNFCPNCGADMRGAEHEHDK